MFNFIAEKILKKAIEDGSFDDPSMYGDDLELDENPFQNPAQRLSFHILKNAGYRPPWLETEIEIRQELERAQIDLVKAAKTWNQQGEGWIAAQNEFNGRVHEINLLIRELNLKVPLSRFQRAVLKPNEEVKKVLGNLQIE